MVKKDIHRSIGGFDETITFAEDVWYARLAAKISKYGYVRLPVRTYARRYEKDGRFTYVKYVLAALHIMFLGPIRSDIFNYKFNHYK